MAEDQDSSENLSTQHLKVVIEDEEEEEDEFCSCCGEDQNLDIEGKERDELDFWDDSTVKMFFKGVSVDGIGESVSGFSGIGVVIQGSNTISVTLVQKRLDFYVESSVVQYLALMEGLLEVLKNNVNIKRVVAFTDSKLFYQQFMVKESFDKPLLVALRERVLELAGQFDTFCLKLVLSVEMERPLKLAQVAIGLVALHEENHGPLQNCSICCDDKPPSMMLVLRCSHKFCSQCLKTYANGEVEAGQVPIKCPQLRCNYLLSTSECKLFLPIISYDVLEKAIEELNVLSTENIYCPHNCMSLIYPREYLSAEASFSYESNIDYPAYMRTITRNCRVPWHNSSSSREYQNLPLNERDSSDLTLHCLAQDWRWSRCQLCRNTINVAQGSHHLTCRDGHEFCYSCGAEYQDGQQTCQCNFRDEVQSEGSVSSTTPEADEWLQNSFDPFPMILDAYSDQERSQLAVIQRFLAGFSLTDHQSSQSPPPCTDSYADAMKDLHQLPWLERFVSVISDNYDDYIH
ncbi:E3 ubiquitin-protein ligase RSL1 [Amaranthus tricolor]|uniref:E3 ubiquitin-protein ligase RSL1 n=1 Tax=Amaranthus tricolor TaxID=29722 RepID=UPI002587D974|nr:E3 ubiquitin-protein ligase RSL1 [Amaranthus tricolor]